MPGSYTTRTEDNGIKGAARSDIIGWSLECKPIEELPETLRQLKVFGDLLKFFLGQGKRLQQTLQYNVR